MKQTFNVETLATIDGGRVKKAIEHYVQRALADCADRPALKEARKVTLTISLTPEQDDRGMLDECAVEFNYSEALPKRRSKPYSMKAVVDDDGHLVEGQGLIFNDLSADDPKQTTLDEADLDEHPMSIEPTERRQPRRVS
jgi:hypothetical protein